MPLSTSTRLTSSLLPSPNLDQTNAGRVPLAVILAGAIIGASVTIVVCLISISGLVCILNVRRRKRNPTVIIAGEGGWDHINATRKKRSTTPKPLYDHVFAETENTGTETTTNNVHRASPPTREDPSATCEPRELMAYNLDIPATFKPFLPPPLVTMSRVGQHNEVDGGEPHHYDAPETTYDVPADQIASGYYVIKRGNLIEDRESFSTLSVSTIPHYDQVEIVHDDSSVMTSSLQLSTSQDLDKGLSRPHQKQHALATRTKSAPELEDDDYDHTYCEPLEPSMLQNGGLLGTNERGLPYGPIYDTPKPLKKSDCVLLVASSNVVEIRDLGIGRFGKVSLAATTGLSLRDLSLGENNNKNRSLLVAVKKLRGDANTALKEAFESEIKFMWRMRHANVVRLLGVCRSVSVKFLLMEYMENGDLCSFLQKQTLVGDSVTSLRENEVTPLILLYLVVQVASGMRYLASRKFVHRDLATRNCLVGRDFVVKISDFGMSCNLYESFYYRVHSQLSLPIRWMAFETFYGKFSVRSDVWSYGILLWEVYTLGRDEPYRAMTDEEMIIDAMRGKERVLLDKPEACPPDVYNIMQRCWVHEPLMRADFEEVYSRLFMSYVQSSKQL